MRVFGYKPHSLAVSVKVDSGVSGNKGRNRRDLKLVGFPVGLLKPLEPQFRREMQL